MTVLNYDSGTETLTCTFENNMNSQACSDAAKVLGDQLAELIPGNNQKARSDTLKIIFDLANVQYASSTFLRIVMMTVKRLAQGNFSITNTNQFITDMFKTAALDQLLDQTGNIECHMQESRVFAPSAEFSADALVRSIEDYRAIHHESLENPEAFWAKQADEHIEWFEPYSKVLEWSAPDAKWFVGGKLNVSYNCLDKHLGTTLANKAAIIWEGEPESNSPGGDERVITYRQLHRMVCKFANVLKRNGVGKGDRVLIYLPMVPEAIVAMQACARLGAIHSVVFAGFSAQSVADRIKDCGAKVVVTADGGYRRGGIVQLKSSVDEALELEDENKQLLCETIKKVIVLRRTGTDIHIVEGRDVWWHQELQYVDAACSAESMDSEDGLFILYTSGSTGKPKGIYHTTAGYLLGTKLTHQYVFDLKDTDIFWCTADVGWITGHSYVAYGPLANGATVLMYEGAPNYPDAGRFWRIIEKYGVSIFYTAPTAIRAFMQWGDKWPQKSDLSSLRLLGTVGEPINPQAWIWYNETIGKGRCPIVDTWWQTETGGIMISSLPGAIPAKPGSATVPFFGIQPEVVDDQGNKVPANSGGKLIIRKPWPSMLRGIWGDPDRFQWTYWNEVPDNYFSGDGVRQDDDGYFWIVGRIDDVLNVSGHRIGTAEVESALVSHPAVAEAAVVGRADDVKGFAVVAFVTLISGSDPTSELREELRKHVAGEVGVVARPDEIRFAGALPKTRSGKIMRRLLKQIAAGTEITGDTTTLEDFSVLATLNDDKEI